MSNPKSTETPQEYIQNRIEIDPVTGCWNYTGYHDKNGYGQLGSRVYKNQGIFFAHRLSWIIHYGPISEDRMVLHKCDNPPCCNPEHLFLGTAKDNADDCSHKGRQRPQHGARNNMAKLTNDEVIAIRRLYASTGMSQRAIGEQFGISQADVSNIVLHKGWKHLKGRIEPTIEKDGTKGVINGRAKLTEGDIVEIRRLHESAGLTYRQIAARYNIAFTNVGNICRRENWKHIPEKK